MKLLRHVSVFSDHHQGVSSFLAKVFTIWFVFVRRTPSQLHSLQQIPTQHDMLPQHLIYKNEPNREYVITLARNDETHWWWSEKIETCRSGFVCFKWKLYRCICWLIVEAMWEKSSTLFLQGYIVFLWCNHRCHGNANIVSVHNVELCVSLCVSFLQ